MAMAMVTNDTQIFASILLASKKHDMGMINDERKENKRKRKHGPACRSPNFFRFQHTSEHQRPLVTFWSFSMFSAVFYDMICRVRIAFLSFCERSLNAASRTIIELSL